MHLLCPARKARKLGGSEIHVYKYAFVYIYIYIYRCVCVCIYIYIHICMYVCMHVSIYHHHIYILYAPAVSREESEKTGRVRKGAGLHLVAKRGESKIQRG